MKATVRCILAYPFDTGLVLDFRKLVKASKEELSEYSKYLLEAKAPIETLKATVGGVKVLPDMEELECEVSEIVYSFGTGILQVSFILETDLDKLPDIADNAEKVMIKDQTIMQYCQERAAQAIIRLKKFAAIDYGTVLAERQVYPIFIIEKLQTKIENADKFVKENAKVILGIVGGESEWEKLSTFALESSRIKNFGYYSDEVIVVQDSGAFLYSRTENETILQLLQLAYAQYWKLRAYKHVLDVRLEKAYTLLNEVRKLSPFSMFGPQFGAITNRIFEAASDKLRLIDYIEDISDIPRISEDWHLAKVYGTASDMFGIEKLYKIVVDKANEMENAYESVHHVLASSQANFLEMWIIVIFLVDLLLIVALAAK